MNLVTLVETLRAGRALPCRLSAKQAAWLEGVAGKEGLRVRRGGREMVLVMAGCTYRREYGGGATLAPIIGSGSCFANY